MFLLLGKTKPKHCRVDVCVCVRKSLHKTVNPIPIGQQQKTEQIYSLKGLLICSIERERCSSTTNFLLVPCLSFETVLTFSEVVWKFLSTFYLYWNHARGPRMLEFTKLMTKTQSRPTTWKPAGNSHVTKGTHPLVTDTRSAVTYSRARPNPGAGV